MSTESSERSDSPETVTVSPDDDSQDMSVHIEHVTDGDSIQPSHVEPKEESVIVQFKNAAPHLGLHTCTSPPVSVLVDVMPVLQPQLVQISLQHLPAELMEETSEELGLYLF
jgi:hypothetical protein